MQFSEKWKRTLPLAAAAGIVGLFAYGASHTVATYSDIQQSTSGDTVLSGSPIESNNFIPGSPLCNPLGCAACSGCVSLQYEQSITPQPDLTIQDTTL